MKETYLPSKTQHLPNPTFGNSEAYFSQYSISQKNIPQPYLMEFFALFNFQQIIHVLNFSRIYDIDNSGYISNGELFQVLKMMIGSNLKDTQLQQIVDKNILFAHNGKKDVLL